MIYDAHTHIHNLNKPEKAIEKFFNAGGDFIINVLADFVNYGKFLSTIKLDNRIYATVGIHPETIAKFASGLKSAENNSTSNKKLQRKNKDSSIKTAEQDELEQRFIKMKEIATNLRALGKLVGIGEIGLDTYWHGQETLKSQIQWLDMQIAYAKELKLPVIFHIRAKEKQEQDNLFKQTLSVAQKYDIDKMYFHSFTGTKEFAKKLLNTGAFLGINGIISYKSAGDLIEVVKYIPIEQIFIETDAPYLIPSNIPRDLLLEKDKNESLGVVYIARLISKIKGISFAEVWEKTEARAREFFGIK